MYLAQQQVLRIAVYKHCPAESNLKYRQPLSEFFNENGINDMLESSDFDSIYNESPFLGYLVDSF